MRLSIGKPAALSAVLIAAAAALPLRSAAQMDGSLDPDCVVAEWTADVAAPRIIDINFSDTLWPDTWGDSGTGIQCPEYSTGRYVNAVIDVPANASAAVKYPILFHNVIFANKESNGGLAGATAAFSRQYYESQKATNYNDWKQAGHTKYLEDNIRYNEKNVPVYGEAGFAQMCRNAGADGESLHGCGDRPHPLRGAHPMVVVIDILGPRHQARHQDR